MSIVGKCFTASIVTLLLLGAVVIPCVLYAQSVMGGMHTVMPMDGAQKQCCTIQPTPDFHAALQSTAVHDAYRNLLLIIALLTVIAYTRAFRIRAGDRQDFVKINSVKLRSVQIPLSGFERLLQRGIAQPRLYEPAIVLS